jgi:ankyrin repeat/IBR domain-containing protein 1
VKSKGLEHELSPSSPFVSKSKTKDEETPLHLACECALLRLVEIFLEKGGNPNKLNGLEKTCLHSTCQRGDHAQNRQAIMQQLLAWRASNAPSDPISNPYPIPNSNSDGEVVSVNRVDSDGNSAIHYAAASGLLACVEMLIGAGAIISIVNKAQKTCCDCADGNGYKELADMLVCMYILTPVGFEDLLYTPSVSQYITC